MSIALRLAFLWLLLPVGVSHAATLYLEPSDTNLNRGEAVQVSVRLDTDETIGECVNVVSGEILYSDNIAPVDVSLGRSIFSIWVEEPTIDAANNRVTFAGGMPNGYCGRIQGDPRLTNVLVDLIFRAPGMTVGASNNSATATFAFGPSTQALLNDGFGTKAELRTFGTEVFLNRRTGDTEDVWQQIVRNDTQPPQPFSIVLERNDQAFGGEYYIVFNTTDKQSGIDSYQVIEEPSEAFSWARWGAADAPWVEARSPYVLQDQTLNSTVRVKALDKAGNEYIATLVPDEALRTMSNSARYAIAAAATTGVVLILVLGVVGYLVVRFFKRRRVRREEEQSNSQDVEHLDEDQDAYEYEVDELPDEQQK